MTKLLLQISRQLNFLKFLFDFVTLFPLHIPYVIIVNMMLNLEQVLLLKCDVVSNLELILEVLKLIEIHQELLIVLFVKILHLIQVISNLNV